MALFCDFENVALGVRDAKYEKFDIGKVLERLLLKGSIVVKKAYCDWERYKSFKAPMHEASFELIEIPHVRQSGKNSADIRMVVDALDLCYTKAHVDTFVHHRGDSDFSPLVSKLRENDKTVIGVGVKNSTSDLLIANCDEFIFYDDLVREKRKQARGSAGASPRRRRSPRRSRRRRGRGAGEKTTTSAPGGARPDVGTSRRSSPSAATRRSVGLDGQAGAQAPQARLQRVVLRVPLVQRDARGSRAAREPEARARREVGAISSGWPRTAIDSRHAGRCAGGLASGLVKACILPRIRPLIGGVLEFGCSERSGLDGGWRSPHFASDGKPAPDVHCPSRGRRRPFLSRSAPALARTCARISPPRKRRRASRAPCRRRSSFRTPATSIRADRGAWLRPARRGPQGRPPRRAVRSRAPRAGAGPRAAVGPRVCDAVRRSPRRRRGRAHALTLPQVECDDDAHAHEHSLEVQLPFLQRTLENFRIVPFAVGAATPAQVAEVIELLWGGPETLIVVSSDLSHYQRYANARAADRATVDAILALSPELDHDQACGATPINGLLIAARRHRLRPELLDLRNSGGHSRRQITGRRLRVARVRRNRMNNGYPHTPQRFRASAATSDACC
jgi:uncharacterized LabA/DUF88 family protein